MIAPADNAVHLLLGDCLEVMPTLAACSVDSIVTDPPYGLSFMGKDWDHGIPGVHFWQEALRVAKPGAHLLAFGGTRTYHRLACAIEDAGWEIRDCVMWVYGSGFPKSLDVSKAIDKAAGAQREIVGFQKRGKSVNTDFMSGGNDITAPATEAARQWAGWGTALKPAWEPIILARKPLEGTVAENVLTHGTGAMNIDASRIPTDAQVDDPRLGGNGTWGTANAAKNVYEGGYAGERVSSSPLGRWPANLIHDGSEEVVRLFPVTTNKGHTPASRGAGGISCNGHSGQAAVQEQWHDTGSAARFFYCAKASKADRGDGNHHPTVKPTALMRYLCRLVTPPGGVVLDPFMGSGSTGKAALLEGFRFIGIEQSAEYFEIAKKRICNERSKTALLGATPKIVQRTFLEPAKCGPW